MLLNRAGARPVAACPTCYPNAPAGAPYLVLVPEPNDTVEFRSALAVLRIPYPVIARRDPLGHLPARCWHVALPQAILWPEYYARELNQVFREHGQNGQPGRIRAGTVAHGAFAMRPLAACANPTHGRSR